MIPRVVHHIWLGSKLPSNLARLRETFKKNHPNWSHWLWTDRDIDKLEMTNRDLYEQAHEFTRPDGLYQFKADVARWEILHRFGGVYIDTDTTSLKPLDPLLQDERMVLGWEIEGGWVGIGLIASESEHPAAARIIEELPSLARRGIAADPQARVNKLTGPKAISHLLRHRADVTILPEETFYPTRWDQPMASDEGEFPNSYTVHHWNHQRTLRGLSAPDMEGLTGDRQAVRPAAHRHERHQGAH